MKKTEASADIFTFKKIAQDIKIYNWRLENTLFNIIPQEMRDPLKESVTSYVKIISGTCTWWQERNEQANKKIDDIAQPGEQSQSCH